MGRNCTNICNAWTSHRTNGHVLVAQLLPLVLAAMVKNDIYGGKPALELVNPVGQGGQRPDDQEGSIDLLAPKVTQKANGLHLHAIGA